MATRKKKEVAAPVMAAALEEKQAILDELKRQLTLSLEVMTAAARRAREAATHPEMRPENDKDTRGIEAGYLAAGQSARALEIQRALSDLSSVTLELVDEVKPFALVMAREETNGGVESLLFFLAPHGSGQKVKADGREVQIVSPASPLGQALAGRRAGDFVALQAGGRTREIEIVQIS
jgi:transcription elongation GreA/GreB family factor